MTWIVVLLDDRVRGEPDVLPADMKARFRRIAGLIQSYGFDLLREPQVRDLEGPLWEMRMKGQGRHLASHLCCKARQTPRREIDLALERAKEVAKP